MAEDARRKARLDALADVQRVADRIELHGGAVHDAEHAAAELPALGRERDALDGRDLVVVDRAEGREQRRDEDGAAGVFLAPGACFVKTEYGVVDVLGERDGARSQIELGQRCARTNAAVPDLSGAVDADQVLRATLATLAFGVGCAAVELLHL